MAFLSVIKEFNIMMYKFFNFRIDEQTKLELDFLAIELQRTKSNLVRYLIHKEFRFQKLNAQDVNDSSFSSRINAASTALNTKKAGR